MPLIPFPTRQTKIADAPGAVLDNQRRPRADNSRVQAATARLADAQKMPLIDPDAMAAPYEALGSVGRAIAQTGSIIGAVEQQRQEWQDRNDIYEADAKIAVAHANFETYKAEHQNDPQSWNDGYEKTVRPVVDEVMSKETLSPKAREQIALRADTAYKVGAANVNADRSKRTFAIGRKNVFDTATLAADRADRPMLNSQVQLGVESGVMTKPEAALFQDQLRKSEIRIQKQTESDAERLDFRIKEAEAIKDPLEWTEKNATPWKDDERTWSRIKNTADARISEETAREMGAVMGFIAKGNGMTDTEIDNIPGKYLTPQIRVRLKDYARDFKNLELRQAREGESGVRQFVELGHQVDAYDREKDGRERYAQLVLDIESKVHPKLAGELTGDLNDRYGVKKAKADVRPEIQQNVSKTIKAKFNPETGLIPWKSKRLMPGKKESDPQTSAVYEDGKLIKSGKYTTEDVVDPVAQKRAFDEETKMEMEMEKFFKLHPDPSLEETNKELERLIDPAAARDFMERSKKKSAAAGGDSYEGWATVFGLNADGTTDMQDNGKGKWGADTRNPKLIGVSLPFATLKREFGTADAGNGRLVEVTNPKTGKTIIAPIVDAGPAEWTGHAIDLTYGALKAVGGTGKDKMRFRILPT